MGPDIEYFRNHIKRQISFLEESCRAYDDGKIDEAIRIAQTIRVMIHNTSNSTSVLSHLNATGIKLLSQAAVPGVNVVGYQGLIILGGLSGGCLPLLGHFPFRALIPVEKWWKGLSLFSIPELK